MKLEVVPPAADAQISYIVPNQSKRTADLADRERIVRANTKASIVQSVPTAGLDEVAVTSSGKAFARDQLGMWLPSGRLVPHTDDPFERLIGGRFRFMSIRESGDVVEVTEPFLNSEDPEITKLSSLQSGSAVSYIKPLASFVAAQPDGKMYISKDAKSWQQFESLPSFGQDENGNDILNYSLRVLGGRSGRIYVYAPGWNVMCAFERGADNWKVIGKFDKPIIDAAIVPLAA